MNVLTRKTSLYFWGLKQTLRLGRPEATLAFCGGIGDDLLSTAPIYEHLKRGAQKLWFITRHPELYCFDRRIILLPDDVRYPALSVFLKRPVRYLSYSDYESSTDKDTSLREHIIIEMCRRAGLTGRIKLRPHLVLTQSELASAAKWEGCIAIQTSSLNALVPMMNKQWPIDRFQAVADRCLALGFWCVQIGSPSDPSLRNVTDLRGKMRLRETAALLAQARLFVGLVGFLMHLARAVECPAVIVYGGRESPELTGYPCNANITHQPGCAPCWQRNRCNFSRECMDKIEAVRVSAAIEQMLRQSRGPLCSAEADI